MIGQVNSDLCCLARALKWSFIASALYLAGARLRAVCTVSWADRGMWLTTLLELRVEEGMHEHKEAIQPL